MKYLAILLLACAAPLANACDGVSVQVNGGGCFVQSPVAVQTFAAPVAVQTFATPVVQTVAVAAPVQVATVQVSAVQTFATPVFVQNAHCGGVNVRAFGGGRQRIFGGSRTVVRVRSR